MSHVNVSKPYECNYKNVMCLCLGVIRVLEVIGAKGKLECLTACDGLALSLDARIGFQKQTLRSLILFLNFISLI